MGVCNAFLAFIVHNDNISVILINLQVLRNVRPISAHFTAIEVCSEAAVQCSENKRQVSTHQHRVGRSRGLEAEGGRVGDCAILVQYTSVA